MNKNLRLIALGIVYVAAFVAGYKVTKGVFKLLEEKAQNWVPKEPEQVPEEVSEEI